MPSLMAKQYQYDISDFRAGLVISILKIFMMKEEIIKESVIGFDALYQSMWKCLKGVLWKDSVASFYLRAGENISKLAQELENGKYKAKPPIHFTVTSPKPREIASIAFRDRVYQRSLNDNIVYPIMTKSFIYDNFACQKGKGTDAARNRLKKFLRKCYRVYGKNLYVCQFDIHGYYPNMDHELTEKMFQEKLDDWSYIQVQNILHKQYEGEKGYNPGSQLVQIAGISMLDGMDHYIKERLHIKFYIRYMDDFIIIYNDINTIKKWKEEIESYLNDLKFEINPKKTMIYSIDRGIKFLGFKFSLTNTGKVLMQIVPESVKRERKKLYRLVKKCKKGKIPKTSVDTSYQAWRNHAEKGNNYKLLCRMDEYYRSLWE